MRWRPPKASARYAPKVLAITGTNGKTTTTSLTAHLLRDAGWNVAVAGNIGPTLLDVLRDSLASGDLPQAWVLELSSFQLDGIEGFEPTPPPCSTSARTTSTGMAAWTPTPQPRRASLACAA
jgi:hypothetical protein